MSDSESGDKPKRAPGGKFAKGQSGNPNGAPPSGRSFWRTVRALGTPERRAALAERMWGIAEGSISADPRMVTSTLKLLLEYGLPPPPTVDVPLPEDVAEVRAEAAQAGITRLPADLDKRLEVLLRSALANMEAGIDQATALAPLKAQLMVEEALAKRRAGTPEGSDLPQTVEITAKVVTSSTAVTPPPASGEEEET